MSSFWRLVCTVAIVVVLAISVFGCEKYAGDKENVSKTTSCECEPVEYGKGVFYFPCRHADFANALSSFLKKNVELKVDAITVDYPCGHGNGCGYFVIFSVR